MLQVRASCALNLVVPLLISHVIAIHRPNEYFRHKRITREETNTPYATLEFSCPNTALTTTLSATAVPSHTALSTDSSITDIIATFVLAPFPSFAQLCRPAHSAEEFIQKPSTTLTSYDLSTYTTSTSTIFGSTDSIKKRGVAFNDAIITSYFTGGSSKVSWCYNWDQTGPGSAAGLEYIPTLRDNDSMRTRSWLVSASAAIASGSKHLFSFNEPDLDTQANMDVASAVKAYQQYISPFAGKAKLGAPAVTNGDDPMGLQYMKNFIDSCTGCTIDFINIHWYDSATNFAFFKAHIQDAHTQSGGLPVWITEFAASGSEAEQKSFLEVVIPWLDEQSYVEGYAYFMAKDGILVSGNSINSLGSTFANYASLTISSLIANV